MWHEGFGTQGNVRGVRQFLNDPAGFKNQNIGGYFVAAYDRACTTLGNLTDGLHLRLDPNFDSIQQQFRTAAATPYDPLILDLDGDGIETTSVKSGAHFDHDANGFAERTGWVGEDDGLLAWDRNGNNRIDSGREIFGDQTLLKDGSRAADGFAALAELDSNHDGKIDANDAAWANLQVWKDADGDGYTSAGELHNLSEFNIQSLNLAHAATSAADGHGNTLTQLGGFTKADGSVGKMGNYLLNRDTAHTIAGEWLDVPANIAALPDLRGYGNIYDLHQAMVRDTSGVLSGLVQDFMNETDAAARNATLEQILFKWSGSDTVAPSGRGRYIDARKLAVLEKFLGENYIGLNGASPNPNAASLLMQSYNGLSETLHAQLMAQTHLKGLYGLVTYSWDEATQSLKGNLGGVASELESQIGVDAASGKNVLKEFVRSLVGLNAINTVNFPSFCDRFMGQSDDIVWIVYSAGKSQMIGTPGNDRLAGGGADDAIRGGEGNDAIYGNGGNDVLSGGAGSDALRGNDGSDIFIGGAGNDYLEGGGGNDVYLFGRGSGQDTIYDRDTAPGNVDAIRFAAGLTASDIMVSRDQNHLCLSINGTADRVTIQNWFGNNGCQVEQIQFADGTVWNAAAIQSLAVYRGTDNGERINGTSQAETFDGRGGNDYLEGGGGNDVYLFGRGSGQDTIYDRDTATGNRDALQFGAGTFNDQLWFRHVGNDLEISIIGTSDKATVSNWYSGNACRVESFKTADGKLLLDSQVENLVSAMAVFSPPAAGQTTLPQNYQDALAPVLAANWR